MKDFLTKEEADECFKELSSELAWVRRETTPRMEYYVNEVGVPYTYGKGDFARTYDPQPNNIAIDFIKNKMAKITSDYYHVCFLNRYLNQSDHLGWHSDNSPEMDDAKSIAIVSLGVERDIWFRPIDSDGDVTKVRLNHGSLCLMNPGMQDTFQHRIPKSSFMCGERISLTFRVYVKIP